MVEYYICFGPNVCQLATFTTDEIKIHYANIASGTDPSTIDGACALPSATLGSVRLLSTWDVKEGEVTMAADTTAGSLDEISAAGVDGD